jgi:hypothetical protein
VVAGADGGRRHPLGTLRACWRDRRASALHYRLKPSSRGAKKPAAPATNRCNGMQLCGSAADRMAASWTTGSRPNRSCCPRRRGNRGRSSGSRRKPPHRAVDRHPSLVRWKRPADLLPTGSGGRAQRTRAADRGLVKRGFTRDPVGAAGALREPRSDDGNIADGPGRRG